MKRILRSRLPERFADRVPPLVVEIAVAMVITGLMVLLRIAIIPLAADRAPFAFVFVAGVGATVLAGWRSGLLTVVLGQILVWYFVLYPMSSFRIIDPNRGYALLISTVSELIVVAIVALYQREVDRAWSKREEQVDLIHQALAEIDHRTTNNYQTVLALVMAQAKRADALVRIALERVADRVRAIAMASKQLAVSSDSLLKHAFPDNRQGEIQVSLRKSAGGLLFEVTDDGVGMSRSARTRGSGLGTRLVNTFVKQLGATYKFSSDGGGTRHLITIPE